MPATRASLLAPQAEGGVRLGVWVAALALPILGLVLLLAAPDADVQWEHHPSHFWLVLAAALTSAALAFSTSALALRPERAQAVMRHAQLLRGVLLGAMAVWAAWSLLSVPPLDDPTPVERATGVLLVVPVVAVVLYAFAAARYLAMVLHSGSPILLGVTSAWVLLGEASIAVAFGRKDAEERFRDLYLDHTAAGTREVSVLFADLAGFTSFSEGRQPREVTEMLNAYFEVAIPPIVREH